MPRNPLSTKPRTLRGTIARGLKVGAQLRSVDPEGGDNGAGVIRGMAIITRGEALGHELWIDTVMLQSVADAINATEGGAKARFTHPGLSGDGMGKFTGRVKNASVDGDVVRGDLHFSQSAHDTPDGNLAGYLMELAHDDAAAFGNSIAFEEDFDAETEFMMEHGATVDKYGYVDFNKFKSPDEDNTENYAHARLKELRAVDAVDEPAANPNGLFHRGQQFAQEADSLLSWSLGLSDKRPTLTSLDIDADRVGGFVQRFLDRHNLEVKSKGSAMPPTGKLNDGTETTPATPTPAPAATPTVEEKPKDPATAPAAVEEEKPKSGEGETVQASASDGPKFLQAFGPQGGVWFAEGKTFAQAQELFVADLKSQNVELGKKVAELQQQVQLLKGATNPVSFQPAAPEPKKPEPKANLSNGLTESQAKFAQAIRLPGQN